MVIQELPKDFNRDDYLVMPIDKMQKVIFDRQINAKDKSIYFALMSFERDVITHQEIYDCFCESAETINKSIETLKRFGYLDGITILNEFVYVITFDNVYYKIGKTNNIGQRFKTYNTHSPHELIPVFIIPIKNPEILEAHLLKKFHQKNIKGEWFKLDCDDLEYIKSLEVDSNE